MCADVLNLKLTIFEAVVETGVLIFLKKGSLETSQTNNILPVADSAWMDLHLETKA